MMLFTEMREDKLHESRKFDLLLLAHTATLLVKKSFFFFFAKNLRNFFTSMCPYAQLNLDYVR